MCTSFPQGYRYNLIDIDEPCRNPDVLSAIARHRNIEIVRPCVVIFDNLLRSILVADGQFMINCFIAQIIDVRLDGKRADLERRVVGAELLCIDVRSDVNSGVDTSITFASSPLPSVQLIFQVTACRKSRSRFQDAKYIVPLMTVSLDVSLSMVQRVSAIPRRSSCWVY